MKKEIKKVTINSCVSCGSCQAICPAVFKLNGMSEVLTNVDYYNHYECIQEAKDCCPLQAIRIEWDYRRGAACKI